ncbi:integrase core domain-containing protein [Rhizobium pusense]|nr:integrase core domain-containing protein [Agrobacterium pusense]MDH1271476.1 integrase core domain-containing protein [Agrobacterium pusense]
MISSKPASSARDKIHHHQNCVRAPLRRRLTETALRLIDGWIADYNEIHPHSALKMASPRQFIRAKST